MRVGRRAISAKTIEARVLIVADRAVQPSSNVPVVASSVRARRFPGPADHCGIEGRYNLEREMVAMDGPIHIVGPDGYRLATRDVWSTRQKDHAFDWQGQRYDALGQFQAGSLSADLDERTVRLSNGCA
jgi:lipopolysaccharide export system protein LptC